MLLSVLGLASFAAGECAWVLWVGADNPRGERTWTLFGGFPSHRVSGVDVGWAACKKALDEQVMPMWARQPEVRNPWAVCVPDTVDPRAPRGK